MHTKSFMNFIEAKAGGRQIDQSETLDSVVGPESNYDVLVEERMSIQYTCIRLTC